MRRLWLGLLVVSSLLESSSPGNALVMCSRASSDGEVREGAAIRLRTTCKAKEVEVDPIALGLRGPAGPPGPIGPAGPGMAARDANDSEIGVVQNLDGLNPIAAITSVDIAGASRTVWVGLQTDGFRTWTFGDGGAVYFTSLDCSGEPFLSGVEGMAIPALIRGPMDPAGLVSGAGTTAFFVAGLAPASPVATRSRSFASLPGSCAVTFIPPGTCCQTESLTALLRPAATFDLGRFVPPFRMEAQ
jgi:hypothetical protein